MHREEDNRFASEDRKKIDIQIAYSIGNVNYMFGKHKHWYSKYER